MKDHSHRTKTSDFQHRRSPSRTSAGLALEPPAYGIDFLDRPEPVAEVVQRSHAFAPEASSAPRANKTGMPDQLKANLEAMSGFDLSDVRVHRNSPKPARLSAFAYAQGNEIHLGPGQEQHLPHEAWHVVQQMQGRVRSEEIINGVPISLDHSLELEADQMGRRGVEVVSGAIRPAKLSLVDLCTSQPTIQGNWWKSFFSSRPNHLLAAFRVIENGLWFRVDTRPKDIIMKEGFFPKVIRTPMEQITKDDVAAYQMTSTENPGIVSTAKTFEAAEDFAYQLGTVDPGPKYIYEVNVKGLVEFPQSENIPWYRRIFYSEQQEGMVVAGIEPSRITFIKRIDTRGEGNPSANPFGERY
jgi:Domain of unknown function (DUF4157)